MKKALDFLSSMKFAVVLFVVIIAVSTVATMLPQEKADRYIYHSLWFIAIMSVLMLSTTACLLRRLPKSFDKYGNFFIHLSIPVILLGAAIGAITGEKGLLVIKQGEILEVLKTDKGKNITLPFAVKLNKFTLEKNELKTDLKLVFEGLPEWRFEKEGDTREMTQKAAVRIEKIFCDFVLDENGKPVNRSEEWNNPAVLIAAGKNEKVWLFARYPEYHGEQEIYKHKAVFVCDIKGGEILGFRSDIELLSKGNAPVSRAVEVNRPFTYKGYTIYQHSYDNKALSWSGLWIKKDPGVAVVYLGFILLVLGVFMLMAVKLK